MNRKDRGYAMATLTVKTDPMSRRPVSLLLAVEATLNVTIRNVYPSFGLVVLTKKHFYIKIKIEKIFW